MEGPATSQTDQSEEMEPDAPAVFDLKVMRSSIWYHLVTMGAKRHPRQQLVSSFVLPYRPPRLQGVRLGSIVRAKNLCAKKKSSPP